MLLTIKSIENMKTWIKLTIKSNLILIGFNKNDRSFRELSNRFINDKYQWNISVFGFFILVVKPQ